MTTNTNAKQGREKRAALFVSIYGEKVLTKNVKLSNVEYSLDVYL